MAHPLELGYPEYVGPARTRTQWRQLAVIVAIVSVITPIFNVLTDQASLRAVVQGLVDAPLITPLVGGYLMFVRGGRLRAWFRQLGFLTDLALSSTIVLVLFLVGRAAGLTVTSMNPRRFLTSFTDAHLVYALPYFVVLAVIILVMLQMNHIIGANVLRYFVAGVYHRPRLENRIFLFLDLEGSTQIAERLGHSLLRAPSSFRGRPHGACARGARRDLSIRRRRGP
jgi:adenylate cyclase